MRLSPKAAGLLAAVVTVVIWTSFIVIARASAMRSLNPFDLSFVRLLGAGLVLLPWGWWWMHRGPGAREGGGWLGLSPLSFRITALVGSTGGLAYSLMVYNGFFYAPAVHASVLMPGSLPLWTTLLAAVLLGEPISGLRAVGLALIIGGDLLVGGSSLLRAFDGGTVWRGDLLFMGTAFCWATYGVLARRHRLDAIKATIAVTVFAFLIYVPVYGTLVLSGLVSTRLATAPAGELLFQFLFQGVGSVVLSGISFTRMVAYFGPVRTTMITALVPGLSALGAVLFLAEPLHWNILAGLALVTLGIVFGVSAALPAPLRSPS